MINPYTAFVGILVLSVAFICVATVVSAILADATKLAREKVRRGDGAKAKDAVSKVIQAFCARQGAAEIQRDAALADLEDARGIITELRDAALADAERPTPSNWTERQSAPAMDPSGLIADCAVKHDFREIPHDQL